MSGVTNGTNPAIMSRRPALVTAIVACLACSNITSQGGVPEFYDPPSEKVTGGGGGSCWQPEQRLANWRMLSAVPKMVDARSINLH